MKKTALPFNQKVIWHFGHLKRRLIKSNSEFRKKNSRFQGCKRSAIADIINVWTKACLPVLSSNRIQTKLKELIEKWRSAPKRARRRKAVHVKIEEA